MDLLDTQLWAGTEGSWGPYQEALKRANAMALPVAGGTTFAPNSLATERQLLDR